MTLLRQIPFSKKTLIQIWMVFLIKQLNDLEIRENTLIFFTPDPAKQDIFKIKALGD